MNREELTSYLRAGYPFLAVATHEEDRALQLLRVAGRDLSRELRVLRATLVGGSGEDGPLPPEDVLERIAAHEEPAVFGLLDFDALIDEPLLCRALRDLRGQLVAREQTVVLISAAPRVPASLESDVVVLELPLPSRETLGQILAAESHAAGVALPPEVAHRAIRAVQGMTAQAAQRAFRRALADGEELPAGQCDGLVAEKRRLLRRTDLLEFLDAPPEIGAVGGLSTLKEWLVERERAFSEAAKAFGLPAPKGLLLVGVQGCGKSLTAKAVARLWNLPLARLDFAALFTHGRSPEENLRRVLRVAEALAPVVLWMDEVDKAFQNVGSDTGSSESVGRIFSTFITWLQEKTDPVFLVATANNVDHLPAELLRRGRFDEIFFIDLPSLAEREEILRIHLLAHGRDPERFATKELAAASEHFSGAELEQVVIAALYRAFRRDRDLEEQDLVHTIKATVPLYRTAEEQVKALREWAATRTRRASPDVRLVEMWGRR